MSLRFAFIALLTLPLAACQGTGLPGLGSEQQEPQVAGHKGPPGVSPLEQPIETGADGIAVATAEATTLNTAAFTARGNEPFWSVDAAGGTAIYKTPNNQKGRAIRVNRLNFAGGAEYVGVLDGRPFVLTVRGAACQDDMSGERFPMTAQLKVSGRSNSGCAGPAAPEVAAAVAAVKAPAPPAPRVTRTAAPKPAAPKPAAPKPAEPAPQPATATPATEDATATETPATTPTTPAPATGNTGVPAPSLVLPTTPPAVTDAAADSTPADEDAAADQ